MQAVHFSKPPTLHGGKIRGCNLASNYTKKICPSLYNFENNMRSFGKAYGLGTL